MIHPIYPCIWFDGKAKEAANFYCSIFNKTSISADTPMVVKWNLDGLELMGLNGGPMFQINPSISLFVNCETIEHTNELWDKLMVGGSAMMDIDKYPWCERYGWLKDQFGLTWQISIVNNPGDKYQIAPCLLFTGERFGKGEEAMHFYSSLFKNSTQKMVVNNPPGDPNEGKLMYAEFALDNYNMIAMDGPGMHDFSFNEALSFVVECDTQEEIDFFWDKLIAGGGQESRCGWLKDRFGVSWQIIPRVLGSLMRNPEIASKIFKVIHPMNKLIIQEILNVA